MSLDKHQICSFKSVSSFESEEKLSGVLVVVLCRTVEGNVYQIQMGDIWKMMAS
jgi:hypothetical protein